VVLNGLASEPRTSPTHVSTGRDARPVSLHTSQLSTPPSPSVRWRRRRTPCPLRSRAPSP